MRRSILYLFIALPLFLPAQPVGTVYATVGYSDAHARLHTSELYVLYWSQHWETFVYGEYIQLSNTVLTLDDNTHTPPFPRSRHFIGKESLNGVSVSLKLF